MAQQTSQPAEGSGGEAEIIVTALKRSGSVQNTPATVSVVSADALASANIATLEQLGSVAPGVIIQRPPNNTANATIRGIGTSPGPVSFDQGAALFVDGVYAARGADFLSSLFDIERIEVVKGTQAAVLGKNTSLGAISLTTRKPGKEFAVDALASYEFYNKSTILSGGVNVPLAPNLSVRFAGQYQDLAGFSRNLDRRPPAERSARQTDEWAGRVTAVWNATPGIDVTLSYAHENLKNTGIPYEFVVSSPAAVGFFAAAGTPQLLETRLNHRYAAWNSRGPTRLRQESDRINATINADVGLGTLTSVTGWSRFDQTRYTDYDYTPGDFYDDDARIIGEQFSQELRLTTSLEGSFQFLVGGLYVHNSLSQDLAQDTHYPGGMNGAFQARFDQKTDTWSIFGQPELEIVDDLKLVGGLRVTGEKKRVDMQRQTVRPGPFTTLLYPAYARTQLSRNETVVDGSVTLQYKPTSDLMLYASWGQGTKGGGYSDFALPALAEYGKEVARSVEAGAKWRGPNGMTINGAFFRTVVDNFQNNLFNGTNFVVQNIDVSSTGFELSAAVPLADGLDFSLDGTYAKTKNKNQIAGLDDRLPRSPRLAGKVALEYNGEIGNGMGLRLAGDLTYRSMITHQNDPRAVPPGKAFPTMNAIVGVRRDDLGIEVSLIGRNLNNAHSTSFGFPTPFMPGSVLAAPEDGRSIALQLRLKTR
nr:TonB-dependent receptor [Sphingomonas sp. Y57]